MFEVIVGISLIAISIGFCIGFLVNASIEKEKEAARRSSTSATKQKKEHFTFQL